MKLVHLGFISFEFLIWLIVVESKDCKSPQYLKIGSEGIIQCSFPEDTFGLYWYNSTNLADDNAILTLQESVKSGQGFESGEFNVYSNGSLIITNVSMRHEENYTVIELGTPTSKIVRYTVNVFVIAQTFDRVPVINNCLQGSEICFQLWNQTSDIACTVRDARPVIPLTWVVRTFESDRNLSSTLLIKNGTYPFVTSQVTTNNPFVYTYMLTLLVCKANGPAGLLQRNESLVLLQNTNNMIRNIKPTRMLVEIDSRLQLTCTDSQISYLVWQVNQSSGSIFKNIIYAVFLGVNVTHILEEDYLLFNTSSVVIDNIRVDHEGTYRCISGNGFEDDVTMFEVLVFVSPSPAYLVIDGCDHQQYCVLEAPLEGRLTCSVHRIRPPVDMDIAEVFERSSNVLNFYEKTTTIKENGGTFDVLFTSKYRFSGAGSSRITLECKVLETDVDGFHLSTKFDLLFLQGVTTTTEENNSSKDSRIWIIVVVLACVLSLTVLVTCGLVTVFGKRREKRKTENYLSNQNCRNDQDRVQNVVDLEETIPLVSKSDLAGLRETFIAELKAKYQDIYDAVQPIPYIRDRLYCVNRVFVEGGIEYLVAKDKKGPGGTWAKLSSYHNILDDDRVKSTRRIIEGEPGYGKSTLSLQLSYDWCNKIQQSYLKDTEILILLRLRQLGGVRSIYRAIKQFILPKDTKLTESDIANIISNSSSVLVILDGYDEYPDQDDDIDSDVISIITRKMFQQFEVILTTRLPYLPNKYPPLTKRLKLTGFGSNARDQYIRKAVVGDDVEAAEKIKQRLKENPVLGDLCQVPLCFVMFAHMSHESDHFQKLNSVTSFFKYMISCFHSHMKNKMEDENVQKFDLFERDHRELDKLAFKGLSSKNQQIVWNKKDMCERLGQDFYDQYVRIGILVEEEVLNISEDPSLISCEHIQYKTEVRFYHKLFCEWYAAHHLSEYASRDLVAFDRNQTDHHLKYVDPFDLQYVYRFTCGLNPVASEKVIRYLKTRGDVDNIVILCILEKSGKVEDVLEDVEDLCSQKITVYSKDSLLLKRSTIQLLEIALANQISISSVSLYKCYSTVDLSGGNHLQLKSNLSIPVLTTLNKLTIYEYGREITAEEFAGILQYSSKCLSLKELEFGYCLLPQSVQAESVSVLRSRNVKVYWDPGPSLLFENRYQLNLDSGLWQNRFSDTVMTDQDYQSENRFSDTVMTDQDYQSEVTKFRENIEKIEDSD